jgi:hypothetical protein
MMPKLVELFRKVMMMLMMLTVLSYISLREHHCLPGLVGVAGDDRADGAVRNRLAVRARLGGREGHGVFPLGAASEKTFSQKLGQLQPFIAVFPQESVGQLASFGPT